MGRRNGNRSHREYKKPSSKSHKGTTVYRDKFEEFEEAITVYPMTPPSTGNAGKKKKQTILSMILGSTKHCTPEEVDEIAQEIFGGKYYCVGDEIVETSS